MVGEANLLQREMLVYEKLRQRESRPRHCVCSCKLVAAAFCIISMARPPISLRLRLLSLGIAWIRSQQYKTELEAIIQGNFI